MAKSEMVISINDILTNSEYQSISNRGLNSKTSAEGP